jgi:diguanylate cyclase (GGDEF)-like protein
MADKNPFDDPDFGKPKGEAAPTNPFDDPDYGKPPTILGEGKKGVLQGVTAAKQAAYGIAAMAGKATGIGPVEEFGVEGVKHAEEESKQPDRTPAVGRLEDIHGVRDAALWAAQGLGNLVPSMGASVAGGIAGGLVAGPPGAIAGAGLMSVGQEVGSIYGDQVTDDKREGDTSIGKALAYGVPAGLLDAIPEGRAIRQLTGKAARQAIAKDIGKQIALEGSTEGAQTVLERLGADKEVLSPEGVSDIVNSAAVGALGGGVIGAGGHVLHGALGAKPAAPPAPPEAERLGLPAPDQVGRRMGQGGDIGDAAAAAQADQDAANLYAARELEAHRLENVQRPPSYPVQELGAVEQVNVGDTRPPTYPVQELGQGPVESIDAAPAPDDGAGTPPPVPENPSTVSINGAPVSPAPPAGPLTQAAAIATATGAADAAQATRQQEIAEATHAANDTPRIQVGADPTSAYNRNAQAARDQADRAGLSGTIEAAFAKGASTKDVAAKLQAELAPLGLEDPASFIGQVRSTLGIPPQSQGAEAFAKWQAEYKKRTAPANAAPAAAAPTNPMLPFPTIEAAQKRADLQTAQTGVQHTVIPHPTVHDRFAVQAQGESNGGAQAPGPVGSGQNVAKNPADGARSPEAGQGNGAAAAQGEAASGLKPPAQTPLSPAVDHTPTDQGVTNPTPRAKADETALAHPERRTDSNRRKQVGQMSPEEMKRELLTSHLTGLPNRRAYDEAPKKPVQVLADADSLKWWNDTHGHAAGDEMLRTIGQAIKAEAADAYHLSGDEFGVQADTPDEANAIMQRVRDRLAQAAVTVTTPDGRTHTITGIQLSHGHGTTLDEADRALQQHKAAREASGERAPRGSKPPGTTEAVSEGKQDHQGHPAAEEGVTPPASSIDTDRVRAIASKLGTGIEARGHANEIADALRILQEGDAAAAHAKLEGIARNLNRNFPALSDALHDSIGEGKAPPDAQASPETPAKEPAAGEPVATEPAPLNPEATQGRHPSPIRPPNDKWEGDRGAMPGEPFATLKDGSAALVEREQEGGGVLFEALADGGQSLGLYPTVEEAAAAAERATAKAAADQAKAEAKQQAIAAKVHKVLVRAVQADAFRVLVQLPELQAIAKGDPQAFEAALIDALGTYLQEHGKTADAARKAALEEVRKQPIGEFAKSVQKEAAKRAPKAPPVKKLENTGADLRRHWELVKAELKAKNDAEGITALNKIFTATTRADQFADLLPETASPGAQKVAGLVRDTVTPFKEWLFSKGGFDGLIGKIYGDRGKELGASGQLERFVTGQAYLSGHAMKRMGLAETDATSEHMGVQARLDVIAVLAEEWLGHVRSIADPLRGKTTAADVALAFQNVVWKDEPGVVQGLIKASRWRFLDDEFTTPLGKALNAAKMFGDQNTLANLMPGSGSYSLGQIIANENTIEGKTTKAPLVHPRLSAITRDLPAVRKGNVSPATFKDTFGFADVGFGDWVNSKEDQSHLNAAFDAFMDLANFMGVDPKAIGFGGKLHFTLGALGHGGKAAATFHPGHPGPDGPVQAINLTKTKGDGTVAHEWFHALDHFLSKTQVGRVAMNQLVSALRVRYDLDIQAKAISALRKDTYMQRHKSAEPLENAAAVLGWYRDYPERALGGTEYRKNADALGKDYWGNPEEMRARAWEAHVADNLGGTNNYLVNPAWVGDGMASPPKHRGTPYPRGEERTRFSRWYKALTNSLKVENGAVTLDAAKWAANKPTDYEDYTAAINQAIDDLPQLWEQVQREKAAKQDEAARWKPVGDMKLDIGDRVRLGEADATVTSVGDRIWVQFDSGTKAAYGRDALKIRESTIAAKQAAAAAERDRQASNPPPQPTPTGVLDDQALEQLFDAAAENLEAQTREDSQAPEIGEPALHDETDDDAGWSSVGYIEGDDRVTYEVEMRDALDGDTARRQIRIYNANRGRSMATWEWVSVKPGIVGLEGLRIDSAIFHYVVSDDTDAAFGKDATDGDALWRRYGRDIAGMAGRQPATTVPPSGPKLLDQRIKKDVAAKNETTASKLIADAAKQGVKGIDEALKGLTKLFGGGKIQSFPGGFDEATYKEAKPHFEAALKAFQAAGKSLQGPVQAAHPAVRPGREAVRDPVRQGRKAHRRARLTAERIEAAGRVGAQPVRARTRPPPSPGRRCSTRPTRYSEAPRRKGSTRQRTPTTRPKRA